MVYFEKFLAEQLSPSQHSHFSYNPSALLSSFLSPPNLPIYSQWYILSSCIVKAPANARQASALKSIRNLAPLLDRVLVQRVKAESKTAGGIFLPESAVKELNEAKVLAVGPGGLDREGKRTPMSVTAGDRVLIPQVRIQLYI